VAGLYLFEQGDKKKLIRNVRAQKGGRFMQLAYHLASQGSEFPVGYMEAAGDS